MGVYRYGFNGKENDNEVKGEGNQQDYGMRIYDPRIGRFFSVDPISSQYPYYTPYQFAGNDVIRNVDLDGLEPLPVTVDGDQIVYQGGLIPTTVDIYRITYLNVVLGFKLPINIEKTDLSHDEDPYNTDEWDRAYKNTKYFFSHHFPAFSRSKAATKVAYETVAKGLFTEDVHKAIEQINMSEQPLYRYSIAENSLFIVSLFNGFKSLVPKPAPTSSDPLVQKVIDGLESSVKGSTRAAEVIIKNPVTQKIVTDFDIVTGKAIVEVTRGNGAKKLEQIQERIKSVTNKEVILFAPNIGKFVEKSMKENNIKVFKKVDDLVKYLNE